MLIGLFVIFAIFAVIAGSGIWLLRSGLSGGNAKIKIPKFDIDLDVPVGASLTLVAMFGMAYSYSQFAPRPAGLAMLRLPAPALRPCKEGR